MTHHHDQEQDVADAISLLLSLNYTISSSSLDDLTLNSTSTIIINLLSVTICLISAFIAAGLTMCLLSLSPLDIAIKIKSGNETQKQQASSVAPILHQHHRLLVTLLLFNALANEALPLFLDKLVPSYLAILLSVTLVLVIGEIIPSAIFTGNNQLKLASAFSPLVNLLMFIAYPIAGPIAYTLDKLLGKSHGIAKFNRPEFHAFIDITKGNQSLTHEEANILHGSLKISKTTAKECMIKMRKAYTISDNRELNVDFVAELFHQGFSRVPVYLNTSKNQIKGYIILKQLIAIDSSQSRQISTLSLHKPICVSPNLPLSDLLNLFQRGGKGLRGGHMALVCTDYEIATNALNSGVHIPENCGLLGIITLEDVIEEILQEEILDETDSGERISIARATKVIKRWRNYIKRRNADKDNDDSEKGKDLEGKYESRIGMNEKDSLLKR